MLLYLHVVMLRTKKKLMLVLLPTNWRKVWKAVKRNATFCRCFKAKQFGSPFSILCIALSPLVNSGRDSDNWLRALWATASLSQTPREIVLHTTHPHHRKAPGGQRICTHTLPFISTWTASQEKWQLDTQTRCCAPPAPYYSLGCRAGNSAHSRLPTSQLAVLSRHLAIAVHPTPRRPLATSTLGSWVPPSVAP